MAVTRELPLWIPDLALPHNILFAVTTRQGGVSQPPYDTLNLSFAVGDDAENVLENRHRVARTLGFSRERIVAGQQVHGNEVAIVCEREAGRGASDFATAIPATDALVTNDVNLPLTIYVADCVPVLICDPVKQVIGLAHVGWRGALARVMARTVEQMTWHYDCSPDDLIAIVGPHIGACCFEVGPEVAEQFAQLPEVVVNRGTQHYISLAKTILCDLEPAGLKRHQISVDAPCTKCQPERFFSHRTSGGRAGRMMAVAMLRN